MIKIILTQDVEHLGAAGSVQSVRDGFARNYLLPKRLAVLATPGALKQVAERQAAVERRLVKQEAALQGLADRIQGQTVRFQANVGRDGRLFGSITASDIAERLAGLLGEMIDRRQVVLHDPIRSIGEHTVVVHVVGRLNPTVTIIVEGEVDATAEAATSQASETAEG
jgi:large subunit ribosomal protein L9